MHACGMHTDVMLRNAPLQRDGLQVLWLGMRLGASLTPCHAWPYPHHKTSARSKPFSCPSSSYNCSNNHKQRVTPTQSTLQSMPVVPPATPPPHGHPFPCSTYIDDQRNVDGPCFQTNKRQCNDV